MNSPESPGRRDPTAAHESAALGGPGQRGEGLEPLSESLACIRQLDRRLRRAAINALVWIAWRSWNLAERLR